MDKITGNTPFQSNGKSLGFSMEDFWKFQFSNIYDMQEHIAEYIVAKALGRTTADNRDGWTLFDIYYEGKRIEIKETSYYHSWQEKIVKGKISKQRTFSIQAAYSEYKNSTTTFERQNDIYVFCLNTGTNEEESNPLEMTNWEFYVVPTSVINANCPNTQKTISLGKVRKLAPMTKYEDLKAIIDNICDTIKTSSK